MLPEQLATLGNDIESVVLNRAVQWHAEHRIFESPAGPSSSDNTAFGEPTLTFDNLDPFFD